MTVLLGFFVRDGTRLFDPGTAGVIGGIHKP
jgi:hypothetical protein